MASHQGQERQNGRAVLPKPKVIDFGPRQRAIAEQLQRDEGYAAHLKRELAAAEERIIAARGKLDLIADIMTEWGEMPQPVPEVSPPETIEAR